MPALLKVFSGIVFFLLLIAVTASGGQPDGLAAPEGLEVIRAMQDARNIRASARLASGDLERLYYVAAEEDMDVFCILARNRGGEWAREAEAFELLPRGMAEKPHIAFENNRRVYVAYYPDDVVSTSLFLYGVTLEKKEGRWYVEAVSFGSPEVNEGIFKALVVNLATKNTSAYAFNIKTEEVVSSREFPNKFGMVSLKGFSLDDFKTGIGIHP